MIYNFANGTARQKALWQEAIGYLLNLPSEAVPLTAAVEFVPTLTGENATSFAETSWAYGAGNGSILVRNDAPGFGDLDAGLMQEAAAMGLQYDPTKHFHETAVHETGHAVFAAIGHNYRLAIARMFGADSDDPSVLQPSGAAWQNRIGEGIAETFKEAFLPARYRVFPNRTNHKISYAEYPKFRRLIREGLENLEGTGGGESEGEKFSHDVLELTLDNMRDAWLASENFTHVESNSYATTYEAGYSLFDLTMESDHIFEFSFTAPLLPVVKDAGAGIRYLTIYFGFRYFIEVNGVVKDSFRGVWADGRPTNADENRFYSKWRGDSLFFDNPGERVNSSLSAWRAEGHNFFLPNAVEGEGEGYTDNYVTWEGAQALEGGGPLPKKFSTSVAVDAGDVVKIHCRALGVEYAVPGGPNFQEEAEEDMVRFNSPPWSTALPLMFYHQGIGATFCYEYFSDVYPDPSGHDWPARHLGDRDDEAFVLWPEDAGDLGVDMSQFTESSHLAYSIELEEGGAS